MMNFESMNNEYRNRIKWRVFDLLDKLVVDHVLKGGTFDAQKITMFFMTSCRISQLITDLEIGSGLDPLEKREKEEEKKDDKNSEATRTSGQAQPDPVLNTPLRDAVSDLREGNTEGPTGCFGNEGRVRNPNGATD